MQLTVLAVIVAAAVQDSHVPAVEVSGTRATFDAEAVWIQSEPAAGAAFELVDKSQQAAGGQRLAFNSGDRDGRITWELSPGAWQFVALGHADNLAEPNRQRRVFDLVIEGPSRTEQLQEIAGRYLRARMDFAAMGATRLEIFEALLSALGE